MAEFPTIKRKLNLFVMKVYNYITNKLYESEAGFPVYISVECKDPDTQEEKEDVEYRLDGFAENSFSTWDEAYDTIKAQLENIADEEGLAFDDYFTEDADKLFFTIPGYISYEISISDPSSVEEEEIVDEEDLNESVSKRFAKYRSMFESEDKSEEEKDSEDKSDEDSEESEESEEGDEKDSEDEDEKDSEEDDEEAELTAIELYVAKKDAEKCKQSLIDAGIPEDAIEVEGEESEESNEGEDDGEDEVKITVDAEYAVELKDYLAGKGIDLEEKIGGTIESEDDSDEEGDEESDEEDGEEKEDDIDFDNLGDLFGAEE